MSTKIAVHRASLAGWSRRAESGSFEGGTFGDLAYMPFLVGLLLVGLVFALVGFWRVGASYSAQYSTQVGSVAPGQGGNVLTALWSGWSHDNATGGGFALEPGERNVRTSIDRATTFSFLNFGAWDLQVDASTNARSERFYPGGPVCGAEGCSE